MINMSTTSNVVIKPVSSTFLDFLLGLEGLGGVEVLQGALRRASSPWDLNRG